MKRVGELLTGTFAAVLMLVIAATVWAVATWILGMLPFHGVFHGHEDWETGVLFVVGVMLAGYVVELRGKVKAMGSALEFQAAEIRRLRGDD